MLCCGATQVCLYLSLLDCKVQMEMSSHYVDEIAFGPCSLNYGARVGPTLQLVVNYGSVLSVATC